MAYILGISAFYHDSAAALVKDGEIIAAAQEERFSRKKHDQDFPEFAVEYCLKQAGIKASDLEDAVFYEKPLIKFERLLESYLAYAPLGISSFIKAMPPWIKQKLWIPEIIHKELPGFNGKLIFPSHHESHAASAFYPSPFQEAAILTLDGVGEWATASFGIGKDNDIRLEYELRFPHSLGLLYSAFTYYTGFKVNSGEYKLMGLAPYGEPKYKDIILRELLDLKEDGSFKLNMRYFPYPYALRMLNRGFECLFGQPARRPESKITQFHMDIARSIQEVTEEAILRICRQIKKISGQKNLCLAGGVALNCVANGKVLKEKIFENIWVQPASGDAGGALGAALFGWYKYLGNKRIACGGKDSQKASYLGPDYPDEEIEDFLKTGRIPYRKLSPRELPDVVADLLAKENIIGWFQGRMEFGPRALGGRSILADARSEKTQSKLNLKIKFRESFRPFAPSVLKEKAGDYFDLEAESPYMLLTALVKEEIRRKMSDEENRLFGIEKLNVKRSTIPAVTHVDYSARVQTVSKVDSPLYYELINAFYKKTGCAVIVNTSFNVRGEPLVCRPREAYQCFMRTDMDYLAMGSFLLDKRQQPALDKDTDWQKEFTLD
ncbi:MAG TPA: carbamoyltransferase [Candidatus Omnitrophota bacterium]|nr:carbamoyltransferase [Candidatus Omnitrophota bacterium]